jgi:succinate dehydrogenase/fumarate reductase flavoprotein subunit
MKKVAVIGAGAAGLAAAHAAARAGAHVTLYERHGKVGGTTALSGGVAWLPGNEHSEDSADDALAYMRSLALGDVDPELVEVFVRESRATAARLERETPLRWEALPYPDYHSERPGGRADGGRSLEPVAYDAPPSVRELVRDAPNRWGTITYAELWSGTASPDELAAVGGGPAAPAPPPRRAAQGTFTAGQALTACLLEACLEGGVELRLAERITSLPDADAVVLASGGFERDESLVKAFLRGPMVAPTGVPTNEGDGLRMAIAAGAALGTMSEAWWAPAVRLPGDTIDGAPMYRLMLGERARPGCLIVDRSGRRFVDESQNYNDVGRTLQDFDAATFSFRHVPAWLVFDAEYRRRYRVFTVTPDDPDPDWLVRAGTPDELAAALGVPPAALTETLAAFNRAAGSGADPEFGRGEYAYDRFVGELGPLGEGPYYALEILPGCLGTKGGPATDSHGRVLSAAGGTPIPGLYAAGNAAASPFGLAYPGAGGTIGPALVFGLRAGEAAAGD